MSDNQGDTDQGDTDQGDTAPENQGDTGSKTMRAMRMTLTVLVELNADETLEEVARWYQGKIADTEALDWTLEKTEEVDVAWESIDESDPQINDVTNVIRTL